MLAGKGSSGAAVDLVFRGGEREASGPVASVASRRGPFPTACRGGRRGLGRRRCPRRGRRPRDRRPGRGALGLLVASGAAGLPLPDRRIRPTCASWAPFFQGVNLALDDPLLADSHWAWPMFWEAGLAILQGAESGFWIHTRDDRFRYKALHVGTPRAARLGLDSEAYGPIDDNLAAGGLACGSTCSRATGPSPPGSIETGCGAPTISRPDDASGGGVVREVALAVSWWPGDVAVSRGPGGEAPPGRVLLHFPTGGPTPTTRTTPPSWPARMRRPSSRGPAPWASASCPTSTRSTWTHRTRSTPRVRDFQ